MSEFTQWLTYRKTLAPEAGSTEERKTATRLNYILLGAWLVLSTGGLFAGLCSKWPPDAELSTMGLAAGAEIKEAHAARITAVRAEAEAAAYATTSAEAQRSLEEVKNKPGKPDEIAAAETALKDASDKAKLKAENAKLARINATISDAAASEAARTSSGHTWKLLQLVMLLGALGGQIHALTSFSVYWGNQAFVGTWTFYYLVRPVVGALLALLVYLGVLGGVFGLSVSEAASSNLGLGAACVLVGMCSEMAVDKFAEIFKLLFQTKMADARADTLAPKPASAPELSSINPTTMPTGTRVLVKLKGANFTPVVKVKLDGQDAPATYKSPTELELPVASLPAAPGEVLITVFNPATNESSTPPIKLSITA